jgi:hypothetical protein
MFEGIPGHEWNRKEEGVEAVEEAAMAWEHAA